MSTNHHHHRQRDFDSTARIRAAETLFIRANPFLEAVWCADEHGMCISAGCSECGALEFRRSLATLDGLPIDQPVNQRPIASADAPSKVASALMTVDFQLLRLAPHWYDALDVALFHCRDRGDLQYVIDQWLSRMDIPIRILDLVLFRHARYAFPQPRLADLWIERCLDAAATSGDETLVESLILSCPERVGADPRALRTAIEVASRSACIRAVMGRLGNSA